MLARAQRIRHPLVKTMFAGMRQNVGIFLSIALAVMVGTGFVTAALSLQISFESAYLAGSSGSVVYDLYVTGKGAEAEDGEGPVLPASLEEEIGQLPSVEAVLPLWSADGALLTADGEIIDTRGTPVSYGPTLEGTRGPTWIEGSPPLHSGQIGLEANGAKLVGLEVGDQVITAMGSHQNPATIAGIYRLPAPTQGVVSVAVSTEQTNEYVAQAAFVPALGVSVAAEVGTTSAKQELQEDLGTEVDVLTRAEYAAQMEAGVSSELKGATGLLLAFFTLSLAFSVFLLSNWFRTAANVSMGQYAQLRRVGATGKQLSKLVMAQAALVGVTASAVGSVFGWLMIRVIVPLLPAFGVTAPSQVATPPGTWVSAILIGVMVTVSASFGAALSAENAPTIVRSRAHDAEGARGLRRRRRLGQVSLLAGAALAVMGIFRLAGGPGWYAAAGILLLTAGLLLVLPSLMKAITNLVNKRCRKRVPIVLAAREMARRPRQTSNTAATILVGVAIVSASLTLLASSNASQAGQIPGHVDADLIAKSTDPALPLPAQTVSILREVPDVTSVDGDISAGPATIAVGGVQYEVEAVAINPTYLENLISLPIVRGEAPRSRDEVALQQTFAQKQGVTAGDSIIVWDGDLAVPAKVTGIIEDSAGHASLITTSSDLLNAAVARDPAWALITLDSTANRAHVLADMKQAVAPLNTAEVTTAGQSADSKVAGDNHAVRWICLLFSVAVIAGAAVTGSSLILSASEQRERLSLLRVLGFSKRNVRTVAYVEAFVTALSGTLLGLTLGVTAGAATLAFFPKGLMLFAVPWWSLLAILVATPVLVTLGAVVPAARTLQTPITVVASAQRGYADPA